MFVSVIKTNALKLFSEVVALSCENQSRNTNTLSGQNGKFLNVKACGIYSNHYALKGQSKLNYHSVFLRTFIEIFHLSQLRPLTCTAMNLRVP
jgi:hypothetical protein